VVWDPVRETDVTTYSFSIYSTLLGRVLREMHTNDDPNSQYPYFFWQTFIYGDNGIIAWQESNSSLTEWIWWEYRDPSNATYRTVGVANSVGEQHELDPYGTNQGTSDWTYQQGIPDEGMLAPYPATNNPSEPNTTYSIDGVRVSLDDFIQNLQIFYHGDLELNEAIAKQSANDRNYQRRWVTGYEDQPGYWQTTAVSITPPLSSLIGYDLQNPQDRLNDAKTDLKKRLGGNNGDNSCAKLFGGLKNALKKLEESTISFRSMGGPISLDGVSILSSKPVVDAVTNGKKITINSDGRFMANNGTLPVTGRPGMIVSGVNYYDLDDIASAAFILAHELGHRTSKLEDDSTKAKDPEGANERNRQRVYEACFKNLK